jgi:hypothetical protein
MRDKCASVPAAVADRSNEPGPQLFAVYEQHVQSPVLSWLPIILGLFALAIVAWSFSPVPQSQTLSLGGALFLAVAYVVVTVAVSVCVLVTCGVILVRRRPELSVGQFLPSFCSVAAWVTPVVAFYKRDSLWAVSASVVLSVFGCRLIYRYYLAVGAHEIFPTPTEPQITESSHVKRRMSLTFAVLLLQLGALSIAASMAHSATLLIGSAVIVISFWRDTAPSGQSQSRFAQAAGLVTTLCLATILVGGSLTVYLAVPTEDTVSADRHANIRHSTSEPTRRSARSKSSVESAGLRKLLGLSSVSSSGDGHLGAPSADRPYPILQTLFGENDATNGPESRLSRKKLYGGQSTVLVPDDSYPGMILRPEIKDHVTIVPPLARRRIFDARPNEQSDDPVSIPFDGAYWFFRSSDKTLPPDAIESRGDPSSTSFKTTDYTPISMEARQNFGSLIELSCCKAIELIISNGDRRPGTVAVELILTNTTLPGKPHQSLGIAPVNSTLHWFPGDTRPPVREVLTFQVPMQPAIQSFDEAMIRFELRSPRERWSASVAIENFRFIPRGM